MKKARTPAQALAGLVVGATEKWAKQRRAEERSANARLRRDDVMVRRRRFNIKEAAERVLPDAYLKASANGTLPANPRQIYYAARAGILELTGKHSLDAQYFCQTILVDFIAEHDCDWDLVWDDRGHFLEPHTKRKIGLGTLAVRKYLAANSGPKFIEPSFAAAEIETHGPSGRFGAILFIEKEGFLPLFEAARIAERFDIAIMSSKGMSVTAARLLADTMCGRWNIPLLVLHDFDIAGFSIAGTLQRDTRRYSFKNKIETVDFGLRLCDVEELDLESESVGLGNVDLDKLSDRLELNDATEEEIEFLSGGRRVELNAMTSDQFVAFIEAKLEEHGISKVIPDEERLAEAYVLFKRGAHVRRIVEKILAAEQEELEAAAPSDLDERLRDYLDENPEVPWEEALAAIVAEEDDGDGET